MKLAQIDITNFRCFKSLSIPLRPDVNVLVGVNGAGKTAILDAIAISLFHIISATGGGPTQPNTQHAALQPSDIHILPGSDSAETGRRDFVHFRTVIEGLDERIYRDIPQLPSAQEGDDRSKFVLDEEIVYNPPNFDYRLEPVDRLKQYFGMLWGDIRKNPAKRVPLPVFAYYRATRRISGMPEMGDIFKVPMERVSAFENALDAGANYQAMCQWFYLRENQELRKQKQDNSCEFSDLKAVRQALITMLENVERVFFDDNPPRLLVALTNPGGAPQIMSLEQLSDGYRNLLAVVLDFARRLALAHPNWENPLEAPGILLIDEIDLHLHPTWQQRVIPRLRQVFPNTQLIVATHSPQVLTTVHRENIMILKDQKLYSPGSGTYGAESSRTLDQVMGTASRPPDNEVVASINRLFEMINQEKFSEAERECERLMTEIGIDEPALVEADMMIKNRLWERELGL
ncbi:MAG: AAA family ATPase [Magnetococcales bacterium]|nr:AAA family ATPase [Magnetococcales bacterium]